MAREWLIIWNGFMNVNRGLVLTPGLLIIGYHFNSKRQVLFGLTPQLINKVIF